MTKQLYTTNLVVAIFVIAFVAAGLVITPVLLQDADAERKKPKKSKDNADFTIDEPVIKLVKTEKDKKPKKGN